MSENKEKKDRVSHKAPGKKRAPEQGNKSGGALSRGSIEKYAKFAAVPAIAILLMLIIVVAGKLQNKDNPPDESSDVIELTESVPSDNNIYQNDFSEYELKKNAYPEINQLIETYFKALADCDIETVKKSMVLDDDESFDKKEENMKSEGEYIEAYDNINCYTKNGPEENSHVVYVAYDIKFLQMDTLVPGLARLYVVSDSDGNYRIYSPYSSEAEAYMDEVDKSEDVVLLAREIDEKMAEVLASDEKLRAFMETLLKGATGEGPAPVTQESAQETQPEETTTAAQ